MSQLVQSACPGCKNLLHIPAEWLHQPIRCKHCGMVLAAKQYAKPRAGRNCFCAGPSHSGGATRRDAGADHIRGTTGRSRSPGVRRITILRPRFHRGAGHAPQRARRRKRGSWWKGPAVALAVLVIAGIVTIAYWDPIVAQVLILHLRRWSDRSKRQEQGALKEPPAKKLQGKKSSTTAKATPIKDNPKDSNRPKKESAKTPVETKRPKVTPPKTAGHPFPRRALIVSVHDYLYANPIHDGPHIRNAVTIDEFIRRLSGTQDKQDGKGFKIPLNQVADLSDQAALDGNPVRRRSRSSRKP